VPFECLHIIVMGEGVHQGAQELSKSTAVAVNIVSNVPATMHCCQKLIFPLVHAG